MVFVSPLVPSLWFSASLILFNVLDPVLWIFQGKKLKIIEIAKVWPTQIHLHLRIFKVKMPHL